jgi:hypothetical protein
LPLELVDIHEDESLKYTVQNLLKTTLTLHAIAEAQKSRRNCSIDAEHAFDRNYAEN